jgi:hypothetical protein
VLAEDYQRKMDVLADIQPEKERDSANDKEAGGENGNVDGIEIVPRPTTPNGHVEVVIDHHMPSVVEESPLELVAQNTANGEVQIQAQAIQQLEPPDDVLDLNPKPDETIAVENAERKRQREAIWKPHYVDFELMQNKLIDKENGYLTTRAFEKDVERIHENTLRYRGDIGKSNAMVSECRLNIKDHFQDQQIRMDIERMAAREYAKREAKRNQEKESAKPKSNQTSPVRHSARRGGKAPEFNMFALAELQRKKRVRAGSRDAADGHTDGEQPEPKRVRIDLDVDMDSLAEPVPELANSLADSGQASGPGTHAMAMPTGDALAGQLEEAAAISLDPPSQDHQMESAESVPTEKPREPTPVPETPPPPFVVPDLTNLEKTLAASTQEFTLEELEQLRAMALGLIWKRRADWDRHEMVQDVQNAVEDFVNRVKREEGIYNL